MSQMCAYFVRHLNHRRKHRRRDQSAKRNRCVGAAHAICRAEALGHDALAECASMLVDQGAIAAVGLIERDAWFAAAFSTRVNGGGNRYAAERRRAGPFGRAGARS